MKGTFDDCTSENFQEHLEEIIEEKTASELLAITGAWEVFSEALNDEVLEAWADANDRDMDTGEPL